MNPTTSGRSTDPHGERIMTIVDYDTPGYDYRTYWADRRYEQWAEDHALSRAASRLGNGRWFIDFGGGFGRNAPHYRDRYVQYVIADYSATNLSNAATVLAEDVDRGRAFLVRCDLQSLPFVDSAFDAAMVVRVLHHLERVDDALDEMGRVVGDRWLLDVPIKHHALANLRHIVQGRPNDLHGPDPVATGSTRDRFWNFHLPAVRESLSRSGWRSDLVASVNNLRRWDRGALPGLVTRALQPAVRLIEAAAQRLGRGWWGPNQFVLAQRRTPLFPQVNPIPDGAPAIAGRMACPACRGDLSWTPDLATCRDCDGRYPRVGDYWDFTVAGSRRRMSRTGLAHAEPGPTA
jgi:SAM-dependent methyltransferase